MYFSFYIVHTYDFMFCLQFISSRLNAKCIYPWCGVHWTSRTSTRYSSTTIRFEKFFYSMHLNYFISWCCYLLDQTGNLMMKIIHFLGQIGRCVFARYYGYFIIVSSMIFRCLYFTDAQRGLSASHDKSNQLTDDKLKLVSQMFGCDIYPPTRCVYLLIFVIDR